MKQIAVIKWGQSYSDTYTYGATIKQEMNGRIKFSCPLMPVGGEIKTWSSFGSYQEEQFSPCLPLLKNGKDYGVDLFCQIKGNILVMVEFYDVHHDLIERQYFEALKFDFFYPAEAVNYKIILINKKHEEIVFDYMVIMESSEQKEYQFVAIAPEILSLIKTKALQTNHRSTDKKVLILDTFGSTYDLPVLENQEEVVYVFPSKKERDFIHSASHLLAFLKKEPPQKKITFSTLPQNKINSRLPHYYFVLPLILKTLLGQSQLHFEQIQLDEKEMIFLYDQFLNQIENNSQTSKS